MKGTGWLPDERVGAAEVAAIVNGSMTRAVHCGCIASGIGDEPTTRRSIMGLMLESHLQGGRQNWDPNKALTYGMSITDSCLAWNDTEALLYGMAESLATRAV